MSESSSKEATHLATSPSAAGSRSAIGESAHDTENSSNLSTHGVSALIGQSIDGRYQIMEKLGTGGMGAVYKAEHTLMARTVAIKVLHPHLVENEDLLKRFQQEARVASKLDHPNAIQTYDFGIYKGAPYLVMEYVEGRTLKDLVEKEGPLSISRMKSIFIQVCSALSQAHGLGIIHRDLKPENIMLVKKPNGAEEAMVVDFGIAKLLNEQGEQNRAVMTQVGTFYGTPKYASPEQAVERRVDKRSDIYTLGVILYEVLTGEVPFDAPSVVEILMKHVNTQPIPLRKFRPELKIPQAVDDLVMKCLQKKADLRFQSVEELQEALESIQTASRYKKYIIGAVALGAAAAIALVTIVPRKQEEVTQVAAVNTSSEQTNQSLSEPSIKTEKRSNPFVALIFSQALKQLHSDRKNDTQTSPDESQAVENNAATFSDSSSSSSAAAVEASDSAPSDSELSRNPEDHDSPSSEDNSLADSASSSSSVDQAAMLLKAQQAHQQTPVNDQPIVDQSVTTQPPSDQQVTSIPEAPPSLKSDDALGLKKDFAKIEAGKKEAAALYSAGRELYKQRRYAEAAAKFEKAIGYRSDAVGSYISLGNCYMRLNQLEKAKQAYTAAITVEPRYGPAHYGMAGYYAGTGQKALAIASLRKALDIDTRARSFAESDPDFASLRDMPEFQKLVQ